MKDARGDGRQVGCSFARVSVSEKPSQGRAYEALVNRSKFILPVEDLVRVQTTARSQIPWTRMKILASIAGP